MTGKSIEKNMCFQEECDFEYWYLYCRLLGFQDFELSILVGHQLWPINGFSFEQKFKYIGEVICEHD